MTNPLKKIFLYLFEKIAGKKRFQNLFRITYQFSLKGLNYGNGGNFKNSGELNIFSIIDKKFAKEKSITIFDVGANIGNYSLELSEFFKSKAAIYCFEPSLKTYQALSENINNNPHIKINNVGFSDTEHSVLLYSNKEKSGLSSVYQRKLDHHHIEMDKSEKIQTKTIDNYCQEQKIEKIHFLKLDIEGHELQALKGASKMLAQQKIDMIQFEFGGCNIDSKTYFQDFYYLLKDKYQIYRILKNGLQEITEYDESLEIFLTINYLAILKNNS